MKRSLSPSIKKEITLCNNQKNNKRCLIISLNNEFQFVLGGYSIQTGNLKDDLENLKILLNNKLCFILYNINKVTPKCKWILLLWQPEKKVIEELTGREDNIKKKNCFIKTFEKENKYNATCNLNKLIYHNLKNNLLDIVDDFDVPLYNIKNFVELEKCISKNTVSNNFIESKKDEIIKGSYNHSYIKSYLYEYYFLNIELRNCNTFKETSEFMNNLKLLKEENNMSLNLITIDINNYVINSDHLKINSIEEVQEIIQKDVFYIVYKIFETFTFFFFCDESCSIKEKFLYSFFKPQVMELLRKKNLYIFLSVEINKIKYLIDFINSDIKKKVDSLQNNISSKKMKKKESISIEHYDNDKNSNVDIDSRSESNNVENDILSKENNIFKSKSIKKKHSNSKGSIITYKRSNTIISLKERISIEKKKISIDKKDILKYNIKKSVSLKKKKIISINKIKSISLEKRKLLKIINSKMATVKKRPFNLKKKIPATEKKKSSTKIEKKKPFKMNQNNKIPKLVMSRSLNFNKITSLSFETTKSFAFNKFTSLNLDNIKGSSNLFAKTISFRNVKKMATPKKTDKEENSDKNKESHKKTEHNRNEYKDTQNGKNNKNEKKKKILQPNKY